MGRLKIISGILLLIVVLCAWSLLYTRQKTASLVCLLAQSREAVQDESYAEATELVEAASKLWTATGDVLILFIPNETIGQIELQFIQLQAALAAKERCLTLTLMEQISFKINHLYHDELPYLHNVF